MLVALTGTGFAGNQFSAHDIGLVQSRYCRTCLIVIGHLHKTKALASARYLVDDDPRTADLSVLTEQLLERLIRHFVIDVPYENVHKRVVWVE